MDLRRKEILGEQKSQQKITKGTKAAEAWMAGMAGHSTTAGDDGVINRAYVQKVRPAVLCFLRFLL
jgi:hypothetical protein